MLGPVQTGFLHRQGFAFFSFEKVKSALGHAAPAPASSEKAKSGIAAPDVCRTDLGVMPQTRPAEISNGVSLSDKLTRPDRPFVAEQAALDAGLGRDSLVEMLSPNKDGIADAGSQDDVFARADELAHPVTSWPLGAAVVPQIETEAGSVAIFRDEPVRHISALLNNRVADRLAGDIA